MDKPLIHNGTVEAMFLRICTDEQMQTYTRHVSEGNIGLATAFASNIVIKKFFNLVEKEEK